MAVAEDEIKLAARLAGFRAAAPSVERPGGSLDRMTL
jgi:hypothetical protein